MSVRVSACRLGPRPAAGSGNQVEIEGIGVDMKGRWSGEAKYHALLAVAQAAHSRPDLSSVLDAVASALEGLVAVDLIAVVTHEREGVIRARAFYFRGHPRHSGESQCA